MVIIDGFEGKVYIEPDQTTMTKMQEKQKMNQHKAETFGAPKRQGEYNTERTED